MTWAQIYIYIYIYIFPCKTCQPVCTLMIFELLPAPFETGSLWGQLTDTSAYLFKWVRTSRSMAMAVLLTCLCSAVGVCWCFFIFQLLGWLQNFFWGAKNNQLIRSSWFNELGDLQAYLLVNPLRCLESRIDGVVLSHEGRLIPQMIRHFEKTQGLITNLCVVCMWFVYICIHIYLYCDQGSKVLYLHVKMST